MFSFFKASKIIAIIFLIITYSCKKQPAVSVKEINYKGWKNAVELKNGLVCLVVVPQVGRIIHYGFDNEENVLFVNKEMAGATFKEGEVYLKDGKPASPFLGGDKVWTSSEEYFHLLNGSRFIADQWIEQGPYSFKILEKGVKIESPVSKIQGVKYTRIITLEENTTVVKIEQELEKVHKAKSAELDSIPLCIWNLTKIKPHKTAWLPLNMKSVFKDGYIIPYWPDAKNYATDNVEVQDGLIKLNAINGNAQKIGADAMGWVAGFMGEALMIERFKMDNNAEYPDGGTSATIFSCPEFSELECLSPQEVLKIGEKMEYDIEWELIKVNDEKDLKKFLTINSILK